MRLFTVCFLSIVVHQSQALSQFVVDGNEEATQTAMETWYKVYESIADAFQVQQSPSSGTELNPNGTMLLHRQTILTINNPQHRMRHGRVSVWTDDQGRPIVISSVKSVLNPDSPTTRRVFYEFHSLSQSGVSASRDDKMFWHCEKPGVTWLEGNEELRPSERRTTRLSQMKSFARRFSVEGPVDEFRLMPTPIYRYPSEVPGVTDGAIFAFSLGTEPIVFLLIEARSNLWHLAFARSGTPNLTIKKGSEPFVTLPALIDIDLVNTEPFYLKWHAEHRSIQDPEKVLFQAVLPTPN